MTARDNIPVLNLATLTAAIDKQWDEAIVPAITEYIRLPAKSPGFDSNWEAHGYLDVACEAAKAYVLAQPISGVKAEIVRLPGRTPVLFFEVPASGVATAGYENNQTIMFYGHLDKQPEMTGWREGMGPWIPVYEDGKLYGRGGADDGYAVYAAMAAISALDAQGAARPRCVGVIETCEESGSYDLPPYLDLLHTRLGDVALVIALDSGCGNYDQLWVTTSLRGMVGGVLRVDVLNEGVHSGDAGGVVPSSFRVARQLLDRIDDSKTGHVIPTIMHSPIPAERVTQAQQAATILGDSIWKRFPWATCCAGPITFVQPTTKDPVELILNRTWRASLSVVGAAGLPLPENAGNVLRPYTELKLSLRLPPTVDAEAAATALKNTLENEPPHQAAVTFHLEGSATGWNAPPTAPWLLAKLDNASQQCYGKPAAFMGEGGTIPFMGMLGAKFPEAQMLVTGVLGPKSNAHGPNEFLHVPFAKKLTAAVALVLAG